MIRSTALLIALLASVSLDGCVPPPPLRYTKPVRGKINSWRIAMNACGRRSRAIQRLRQRLRRRLN